MRREEGIIAILLILVGALGVAAQLARGGAWGGESTIAGIVLGLGVLALVVELGTSRGRNPR